MNAALFLADLERKPATLRSLAARLRERNPWDFVQDAPRRIVLLGMGSSAYATAVAAARLRARRVVAVAELASSDVLPQWGPETTVIAVSAGGGSRETLQALDRLGAGGSTIALTNAADSELTARCRHTVLLHAGSERGGVACRTFQHTLALFLALEARLTGRMTVPDLADSVDRAADASADLLNTRGQWLERVTALLAGPTGTHLVAPAHRLSSAQQGALMLREAPRRAAVACEAGDWAHVDVYLTKNTDYRLLTFAGSRWDRGMHEWTGPRRTTVVSVGGEFPDSAYAVRYRHDDIDDVRLLSEVLVPELVAARLWDADDGQ